MRCQVTVARRFQELDLRSRSLEEAHVELARALRCDEREWSAQHEAILCGDVLELRIEGSARNDDLHN